MAYKFWSNVGVAMANVSGIGAAITISGITKASPAVCTYTGGTDPANSNYVLFTSNGMTQINKRIFRVANVNGAGNTFELEGVDSTTYGTFSSGSFQIVTFNTSFATLSEPQAGGGDPVFEDTTLIHDSEDSQAVVSSSAQTYGFTSVYAPSDAALIEANKAFVTRTTRPFLITFSDGAKFAFSGYVSSPGAPTVSGRKVTQPVSISLEGSGTSYAT